MVCGLDFVEVISLGLDVIEFGLGEGCVYEVDMLLLVILVILMGW